MPILEMLGHYSNQSRFSAQVTFSWVMHSFFCLCKYWLVIAPTIPFSATPSPMRLYFPPPSTWGSSQPMPATSNMVLKMRPTPQRSVLQSWAVEQPEANSC